MPSLELLSSITLQGASIVAIIVLWRRVTELENHIIAMKEDVVTSRALLTEQLKTRIL